MQTTSEFPFGKMGPMIKKENKMERERKKNEPNTMAENLPNVFEMGIGDRKIEKKNRCHSENKNVNDFVITLVVVRFFYLRKTKFKAFTFHLPHVSQCVYVCECEAVILLPLSLILWLILLSPHRKHFYIFMNSSQAAG